MNVVVMKQRIGEIQPLSEIPPTLQDLDQAPDHSPLVRQYIRSIGPRLAEVIKRGRNAVKNGNGLLLRQAQHQYEQIRGERGRPEQIDEYFSRSPGKGALGLSNKQAAIEIIHSVKDYLNPETPARYFRDYGRRPGHGLVLGVHTNQGPATANGLESRSRRNEAITDPRRLSRIINTYISYDWEDLNHPPDDYEGVYIPRPHCRALSNYRTSDEKQRLKSQLFYWNFAGVPWQYLRHPRTSFTGMFRPKLAVPRSVELLRILMTCHSCELFQQIIQGLTAFGDFCATRRGPLSAYYYVPGDPIAAVFEADLNGIKLMSESSSCRFRYPDTVSVYCNSVRRIAGFTDGNILSARWQQLSEASVQKFISASKDLAQAMPEPGQPGYSEWAESQSTNNKLVFLTDLLG